jgi:hypothetical protein
MKRFTSPYFELVLIALAAVLVLVAALSHAHMPPHVTSCDGRTVDRSCFNIQED